MIQAKILQLPDQQFNGLKLQIAREHSLLSRADVAAQTHTSASFITACEKGRKKPSPDLELAFAEKLGVNRVFFYGPISETWDLESCHFRHRQTATERLKGQFRSQLYLFTQIVRTLGKVVKFPPCTLPKHALSTETPVEAIAANLRKQWGIGTGTPIDRVCRLVENAGVVVGFHGIESDAIDACSRRGENPVILATKRGRGNSRLHYDIGHELGELIFTETGSSSAIYERLINRFVGALFLPSEGFAPHFRCRPLTLTHLWEMKRTWRVSGSAILQRALGLQLFSEGDFVLWKRKLNARGFGRNEPEEPMFAEPESLRRALAVAAQAGVSVNDIANEIGVSVTAVEKILAPYIVQDGGSPTEGAPRIQLFG